MTKAAGVRQPCVIAVVGAASTSADDPAGVQEVNACNRRDIDQMELTVEATVAGDRRLLRQAIMLEPVTDNLGNSETAMDAMLREFAHLLPTFR